MFNLSLAKEKYKFAASHFAIFGPTRGERLHGHNYYLSISFKTEFLDSKLGMAVEFNEIKPHIYKLCQALDEYILIPKNSPHLNISTTDDSVTVIFSDKKYTFPLSDVKLLPLLNISCEELSKYLWERISKNFKAHPEICELTVEVEETRGQKVSYTKKINVAVTNPPLLRT